MSGEVQFFLCGPDYNSKLSFSLLYQSEPHTHQNLVHYEMKYSSRKKVVKKESRQWVLYMGAICTNSIVIYGLYTSSRGEREIKFLY